MEDVQRLREMASEPCRPGASVCPQGLPADADDLSLRPHEFGRREFAASVVIGGLTILGAVQPAHAGLDDPYTVKQLLEAIKDLACDVAVFVTGLPGPLTDPADKDYVEDQIVLAATKGQKLLNKPISLLFSTPARWLFWMPIDAKGLNLTQIADEACEAACDALDAWCDYIDNGTAGQDEEAARKLWQTQILYCHLFEAAGIV